MEAKPKRQVQPIVRGRERDVVKRCLRGERGAYEEFIELVYDHLIGFAQQMIRFSRCLSEKDVDGLVDAAIQAAVRPEALGKWRGTEPLIRFALRFLVKKYNALREERIALRGEKPTSQKLSCESLDNLPDEPVDSATFPLGKKSVDEQAREQITGTREPTPAERYEAAWRRLYIVLKLPMEQVVALRLLHGFSLTPTQISNWPSEQIKKVAGFTNEEARALDALREMSPSDIKDLARDAEIKLRESVIRHYVVREARRQGVSPLEVIGRTLQSDRERFVVRLRLLERRDFEPISNSFPRIFQEDIDRTEVEAMYFVCLDRVMHSSGFQEILEVILSEVN